MKNPFIIEWNKPLGVKGNPYAFRYRIDFYFFSIRIHKWICSDDSRAYHSHPTNILSFILKGSYINHLINDNNEKTSVTYPKYSFVKIKRNHRHWVQILENPTVTLLVTWGAPKRWALWNAITFKKLNRDKYFLENGNHVCN